MPLCCRLRGVRFDLEAGNVSRVGGHGGWREDHPVRQPYNSPPTFLWQDETRCPQSEAR